MSNPLKMCRGCFIDDNKLDPKVIVAIDFGTHGTGIGYAKINAEEEKEEIHVVQDWPYNTDTKNKLDILLTHDGKFIAFGYDALKKFCDSPSLHTALKQIIIT